MSNSLQFYGLQPIRPLSMGFSRQEYWSRLPCLPLGIFLIRPASLKSPALAGIFITTRATCKAPRVSQGLNQSDSRASVYPEDTKAKSASGMIQFVDRIFSLLGCKSEMFISLLYYLQIILDFQRSPIFLGQCPQHLFKARNSRSMSFYSSYIFSQHLCYLPDFFSSDLFF